MHTGLQRFENAHERYYGQALREIKNGRKRAHWMWYIFPQVNGLGLSETSKHYAIKDLEEAAAFLAHPVLGNNIVTIAATLLELPGNDPIRIFGEPDDIKLRSSMTLFSLIPNTNKVFQLVLDKYFNGQPDSHTIRLLAA